MGARRRPSTRGPERTARPLGRRLPRVLGALGGALGVPVAPARAPRGGARPELRRRRTLESIERLVEARLMEDGVARDLGEAFVFLSDVKNAIEGDRPGHAGVLPAAPRHPRA